MSGQIKPENPVAKFHHYVPQFIIRRFGKPRKKNKLFVNVFDKTTGKQFPSAVDAILGETHFNRVEVGGGHVSVEDLMTSIEAKAAPIIENIVTKNSVQDLSKQDRADLLIFVALQLNRGTGMRNAFEDMIAQFREKIIKSYGADKLPKELELMDENQKKIAGIDLALEPLQGYANVLATKELRLLIAPSGAEFLLGDNPVTISNSQKNEGPWGNLGLTSVGVEIYMPISPHLALAFFCPTFISKIRTDIERERANARRLRSLSVIVKPTYLSTHMDGVALLEEQIENLATKYQPLLTGDHIVATPDNVMNVNSHQISHSERFIISRANNFDLAQRMIADNERYKRGRRMQIG